MGKHFNPQWLLRKFEDPARPGFIWQHDKRGGAPVQAKISKVAQQPDFYDPATEDLLTREVEHPGNNAIQKILDEKPLSPEERVDLVIYVGTMIRRVPFHRAWARELSIERMPETMDIVRNNGRSYIRQLAEHRHLSEGEVEGLFARMEETIQRMGRDLPTEAIERIDCPFPSEVILAALHDMTWRIVVSSGPQFFITSDNPAVYIRYEGYGLGGKEAEIVMPISPAVALHGSRDRSHSDLSRLPVRQKIVREINKRLVSQASRFISRRTVRPGWPISSERGSWASCGSGGEHPRAPVPDRSLKKQPLVLCTSQASVAVPSVGVGRPQRQRRRARLRPRIRGRLSIPGYCDPLIGEPK